MIMPYNPHIHHRKSTRLKGYDYTQPGSYFVNICTANRRCIFGNVEDGEVRSSDIGRIVDEDWRAIPNHYGNVTLDAFQIMPNHLHGIIVINESLSDKRGHAGGVSLRNEKNNLNYGRDTTPSCPDDESNDLVKRKFGQPIGGSLSTIIGAYKSGVTIKIRNAGFHDGESIWQSRFYDHIIRGDV